MRVPPPPRRRRPHRAHLQHLRAAHAARRRAGGVELPGPGARGEAAHVYGDGSQTRSFSYVDDEVRGLPGAARQRRHHAGEHRHRPASSRSPSWPSSCSRSPARRASWCTSRCRSTTRPSAGPTSPRPRELLGWEPQVLLREGLERTAEDFRAARLALATSSSSAASGRVEDRGRAGGASPGRSTPPRTRPASGPAARRGRRRRPRRAPAPRRPARPRRPRGGSTPQPNRSMASSTLLPTGPT